MKAQENTQTSGMELIRAMSGSTCPLGATASRRQVCAKNRRDAGAPKRRPLIAFTLIEMLVVISIMAMLAGLVVWGVSRAATTRKLNRVRTELQQLETVIDNYHENKGFYPPDNTNDCRKPPLFYELTGATNLGGKYATIKGDFPTSANISELFYIDGFVNSDPDEVKNFFPEIKSVQHRTITNIAGTPIIKLDALSVPLPGPTDLPSFDDDDRPINTWRYVSTKPTNNPASYDLWAEVVIGGKVHIIGNWKE